MLPGMSLKVSLDRKLTATAHFQGSEGGTNEGGTVLGPVQCKDRGNWSHSPACQDPKALHSERSEHQCVASKASDCMILTNKGLSKSDPGEPLKWRQ